MNSLTSVGFVAVVVGIALYFFTDTVAEWTAVGYFRLSGEKLNYPSILRFYAIAGIILMVAGSMIGILGLLLKL